MLKLFNISKEYVVEKEKTIALKGVSIEFRKNEFVSILGPSGCGKTTLLNIIGGLDRYTDGDIKIDGVSTKEYDDIDWDTYRNRKIGFVFQSYNLITHMNIFKNVAMSLTLAGVSKDEIKTRVMEALDKVGLSREMKKKPNQLSGGQMQRVAIARALVNNPEIILADEPTGALDTESGVQVMELLKEVARDRLVIMVTHNPALAEEYSTRIVNFVDGEMTSDTMPYSSCEECECSENEVNSDVQVAEEEIEVFEDQNTNGVVGNVCNCDKNTKCVIAPQQPKKKNWKEYLQRAKALEKSSMKPSTAISLSFSNLLSKKGRTLLTSIAGSIGIIGIMLVLSLSNGVNAWVSAMEEDALSVYPIIVRETETNFNMDKAFEIVGGGTSDKREEYPNSDEIYFSSILGNLIDSFDSIEGKNDLPQIKSFLDNNFDESVGQVKYQYGTTFNVYSNNIKNTDVYNKVYPLNDVIESFTSGIPIPEEFKGQIENLGTALASWDEISNNQELLNQQYDLIGDESRWPTNYDEIVVQIDERNQLDDTSMLMLGFISPDEVMTLLMGSEEQKKELNDRVGKVSIDDIIGKEYKILTNSDYLRQTDAVNNYWNEEFEKNSPTQNADFVESADSDALPVKVVGVIRQKEKSVVTSINGVVGYTHDLVEELIKKSQNHPAVRAQVESAEKDNNVLGQNKYKSHITYENGDVKVTAGKNAYYDLLDGEDRSGNIYTDLLRELGDVDLTRPQEILFFSSSFESKASILALFDKYEEQYGEPIYYTDQLEMMMGYIRTMTETFTGVLIGFSAISLIVSTIMIAIIIYTSVLERRKEIGVLRSLGARKKDISRVFLAESSMLGIYSGLIGIIVSLIVGAIANAVIALALNISGLVTVSWWQCLIMFLLSVGLSMFAGYIPSRVASKKDPAIALRSE